MWYYAESETNTHAHTHTNKILEHTYIWWLGKFIRFDLFRVFCYNENKHPDSHIHNHLYHLAHKVTYEHLRCMHQRSRRIRKKSQGNNIRMLIARVGRKVNSIKSRAINRQFSYLEIVLVFYSWFDKINRFWHLRNVWWWYGVFIHWIMLNIAFYGFVNCHCSRCYVVLHTLYICIVYK